MRAKASAAIVLAAALALPAAPRAEEVEPGKLAAIQKRKFRMDHEIFAQAGLQPADAFYKGLGPVAGYTLHFDDVWAWEILRGGYAFRFHTGLRDQLIKDHNVAPTAIDELSWMAGSALMVTPLYGKLAFANSTVIHAEVFFVLGAAVGAFKETYKPGPQAGLGLRVYLSQYWSMRFEGRYSYFIAKKDSTGVVDLNLGLALSLGGAD